MFGSGRNTYILRQYLYEIPYWIFILMVFTLIRFGGSSQSYPDIQIFYDRPNFSSLLLYAAISGAVLGLIFSSIRIFLFKDMCKNLSVGRTILIETLALLVVFAILIVLFITFHFFSLGYSLEHIHVFATHTFNISTVSILLAFFFYASIQFSLILEADKKMGINVLKNLLLGKYHNPKEENRIFMFLDMKGSTNTAEKLGHLKYSRYLQDVFKLLTDLVIDFKAEIYQFVGDEVVLTWKSSAGYDQNNALHMFYGFINILEANNDYFIRNYAVKPEFKAGIHRGTVSVTEVGEINTQIAYHGDVVNTTSRIQELCNVYDTKLLVSEVFMTGMESPPANFKENAAEIMLRGRSQPITIYSLEMASALTI
jgi:adenylate cyclase